MTEHILYIKGVACPYTPERIAAEKVDYLREAAWLNGGDVEVTLVGDPESGFSLRDIEDAFRNHPEIGTVIAHVHGNIDKDRHFMAMSRKGAADDDSHRLWASDFYDALAEYSLGRPLNVFMFSCGSGNGCREAARRLPLGSTLVNFVEKGKVSSYAVAAESLRLPESSSGPFAEALFLNILCNGFMRNGLASSIYLPQISVSANATTRDVWSLWRGALGECLGYDEAPEPLYEETIRQRLLPYLPVEKINDAFETIENYRQAIRHRSTFKATATSVNFALIVNDDLVLEEINKQGLFGAVLAAAYLFSRHHIGAFQTADAGFYLGPDKPPPPNKFRELLQSLLL